VGTSLKQVGMCRPAINSLTLAASLLGCLALTPRAAEVETTVTEPKPYPERMQWWGDGRFGMFIHWGPVSLKGTEISWSRANSNPKCPNNGPIPVAEYDNLYQRFNPTKFNAKEWVAIAQAAGIKYMVLTAKHCDGFLLWDSKVDAYNIMHTPFKRDVCAELAKAAHEAGMRIGWYFSPMDWRDPDCRNEKNAEFVQRMQEELRELLTNYGRIDLLWFDYDGRPSPWDQERTYALVKKLQPQIVINNRLDLSNQDAGNPEEYRSPCGLLHAGAVDRRVRHPAPVGIVHDALCPKPVGLGRGGRWGEALPSLPGDADSLRGRRWQCAAQCRSDAHRRDCPGNRSSGSGRSAPGWRKMVRAFIARAGGRSSRATTAPRPAKATPSISTYATGTKEG